MTSLVFLASAGAVVLGRDCRGPPGTARGASGVWNCWRSRPAAAPPGTETCADAMLGTISAASRTIAGNRLNSAPEPPLRASGDDSESTLRTNDVIPELHNQQRADYSAAANSF